MKKSKKIKKNKLGDNNVENQESTEQGQDANTQTQNQENVEQNQETNTQEQRNNE